MSVTGHMLPGLQEGLQVGWGRGKEYVIHGFPEGQGPSVLGTNSPQSHLGLNVFQEWRELTA